MAVLPGDQPSCEASRDNGCGREMKRTCFRRLCALREYGQNSSKVLNSAIAAFFLFVLHE